jgi:hypothetical protein
MLNMRIKITLELLLYFVNLTTYPRRKNIHRYTICTIYKDLLSLVGVDTGASPEKQNYETLFKWKWQGVAVETLSSSVCHRFIVCAGHLC